MPSTAGLILLSPSGILLPFGAISNTSCPSTPASGAFRERSRPATPSPWPLTKPTTPAATGPAG
jgi:hypothetical protein